MAALALRDESKRANETRTAELPQIGASRAAASAAVAFSEFEN
jgi:hypothetical protein